MTRKEWIIVLVGPLDRYEKPISVFNLVKNLSGIDFKIEDFQLEGDPERGKWIPQNSM